MISNWKKVVTDDDVIFHLGDIAASIRGRENRLEEIFNELPGQKYLVRGNHDHKPENWYKEKLGFLDVSNYYVLGDIILTHYPLITHNYQKAYEKEAIKKLKEKRDELDLKYVIHGHIHNRTLDLKDHFNVSVEMIDYSPIELNELLSFS